jgi:UDP-N-acetylmuramate dehydrogenase
MDDLTRRREEKQPLDLPSAGSTFKRPEGHFAGKLIMDAGLMGYQVGGAAVSTKHAGFVVNVDHASAADVAGVIRHVISEVERTSGVTLEPEVRLLGRFE